MKFSAGARYDNIRMCVATSAGTPGGPMADIALTITKSDYELIIPIFRPTLFLLTFQMLQFEPEITWFFKKSKNWIMGAAAGVIFHYGPDFQHEQNNRGRDFFAIGPKAGYLLSYKIDPNTLLGIRTFAGLLISNYRSGVILSSQIEYTISF